MPSFRTILLTINIAMMQFAFADKANVYPRSYEEGQTVHLWTNRLTSIFDQFPIEANSLPSCFQSFHDGGEKMPFNMGEFVSGNRMDLTPYHIQMKKDMYCEQLCVYHVGRAQYQGVSPSRTVKTIQRGYHHNWIVDNLPSAGKYYDANASIVYKYGFPVGYLDKYERNAYIYNHVNIALEYHEVEGDDGQKAYRIVFFSVEPLSIDHNFTFTDDDDDNQQEKMFATIENPIASCDPHADIKEHTTRSMTMKGPDRKPQLASGKVLFTYDVKWTENKEVSWASRWNVYLTMGATADAEYTKVRWMSITNGLIVVIGCAASIASILVRLLRRDYVRYSYSKVSTDEEESHCKNEFGWKLVHTDIFRSPNHPMILAVCCGTGTQLLCTSILTLVLAAMKYVSYVWRGSLIMVMLISYPLMGGVAGYVTARLYKSFNGKRWKEAAFMVAFGFPSIVLMMFFLMNMSAGFEQSLELSRVVARLAFLILLWLGVSTPLVLYGAYLGFKFDAIEFPVNPSETPRQIPDQPWFLGPIVTPIGTGILPFGIFYQEVFSVMFSMWGEQYFYLFEFLLFAFLILLFICAEATIIHTFHQICKEDYHWWWRSFNTGGSVAFYIFAYSLIFYFLESPMNINNVSPSTKILYFGYMNVACFGVYLMTGTIGLMSSFWFNMKVLDSIKMEIK